jgi:putative intracellular protease/amidase
MLIAILLFEEITALDAVGPYEVLARLPGAQVRFVGTSRGVVKSDGGLGLSIDHTLSEVTQADMLVLPGGFGARRLARDEQVLAWLRAIDDTTSLTTTVCTGSLLLGVSGLLRGRRATTHWAYHEQLAAYGATPVAERVVCDGKYRTAAGVSAGIDLGLALALELHGRETAEAIQLSIEYDPAPPLQAGSPGQVSTAVRERLHRRARARDSELAWPG